MTLRAYQCQLKHDILTAWANGAVRVCGVLPTGGGKTKVFSSIISDHVGVSCAVAHRQELVGQMSMHLAREGVAHRIFAPKNLIYSITKEHREELGRSFYNPSSMAAVGSVDTLVSRQEKIKDFCQQVTLWTVDEAHHVLRNNKWGRIVELFPNAKGLGVTATPMRADGRGIGIHADGVFDSLIIGPSMRELIAMGYLTDYEIVLPESDFDASALKITGGGDYSPKELKEAARKSHIVGDVVEQYIKWASGKRGITFATDVETANDIAEQYKSRGIPAASVNANTPEGDRNQAIKAFRRGDLMQLVNVDLFGEGFDVPAVEVISMARPTKSLGLYLQQAGRSLRPMEGKTKALIIDHVSNVREHGLPDRPRRWTLDGRDRRKRERDPGDIPVTTCLKCYLVYERSFRGCPHCGFEPEPGGRSSPETVDGDLLLLDGATLDRMRQAVQLEAPGAIAQRVAMAAGEIAGKGAAKRQLERIEAQRALADAIALWAGYGRAEGKSDSELHRIFYFWQGVDVLTALSLPRDEMEKMKARIESQQNG